MFGSANFLLRQIIKDLRSQTGDFADRRDVGEWFLDALRSYEAEHSIAYNETVEKLYLGIEYIRGAAVFGDVAEFGTQYAISASAIALAMREFHEERTLHLFDSFEGLPRVTATPDLNSPHFQMNSWVEGALRGFSPKGLWSVVRQYLPDNQIKVYPGYFQTSLGQLSAPRGIAMVHIDCDLYQSASDVLEHLFSNKLLVEGAIIYFDDFNCNRCSPTFGERKAWSEVVDKFDVIYSDGGMYGCFGQRFFLHEYKGIQARTR